MHKKILYTAVLAAVMSAPQVSAAKIELSEAFEYNAFIFDSFTGQSSDVEGRLAVGGEMNVSDFNVGLLLSPDMSESALAVGGNLHFTRGDVHGGSTPVSGMVFGSELTFDKAVNAQQTVNLINSTVKSGGISSKGDVKLGNSNVVSGDVHANTVKLGGPNSVYDSVSNPTLYGSQVENGNVFAESSVELDSSEVNGTVTLNDVNNYTAINGSTATSVEQGSVSKANVNNIDFNAIAAEVTAQSQEFASMSVNGTTTLSCTDANDSDQAVACTDASKDVLNTITFSGSDDINIYNIDASWFSAAAHQISACQGVHAECFMSVGIIDGIVETIVGRRAGGLERVPRPCAYLLPCLQTHTLQAVWLQIRAERTKLRQASMKRGGGRAKARQRRFKAGSEWWDGVSFLHINAAYLGSQ